MQFQQVLAWFQLEMIHNEPPKARQSYLLLNQLGRVSMLHETYQTGGIWVEASMPNPEIVRRCCSFALGRLYSTSRSKYSKLCDIERLTECSLYISARLYGSRYMRT